MASSSLSCTLPEIDEKIRLGNKLDDEQIFEDSLEKKFFFNFFPKIY